MTALKGKIDVISFQNHAEVSSVQNPQPRPLLTVLGALGVHYCLPPHEVPVSLGRLPYEPTKLLWPGVAKGWMLIRGV